MIDLKPSVARRTFLFEWSQELQLNNRRMNHIENSYNQTPSGASDKFKSKTKNKFSKRPASTAPKLQGGVKIEIYANNVMANKKSEFHSYLRNPI
jgi:hypothetical protein